MINRDHVKIKREMNIHTSIGLRQQDVSPAHDVQESQ